MKYISFLFFTFLLSNALTQSLKGYEIDSIKMIDSLFTAYRPIEYDWIKRNGNELYISHRIAIYDSTRQVQNRYKNVVDTLNISILNDSTAINRYYLKYKIKGNNFAHLIRLIENYNIVAVEPAGPGDCSWCSNYIFINSTKAFVVQDINGYCYPENCYWKPKGARIRKIKKNIYIVRKLNEYH